MRQIGGTFGRRAGRGGHLVLAAAVALVAGACGGDGGSAGASEGEAMDAPAGEAMPAGGAAANQAVEPMAATGAAAPMAQELPAGVTAAMLDEGKKVFTGAGICFSCHGPDGKGIPNLGANLTDGEWIHSDGSFEGIATTVAAGVAAEKSSSGVPMPPKGGAVISDAQVRAVAAYVWSLSHGGS